MSEVEDSLGSETQANEETESVQRVALFDGPEVPIFYAEDIVGAVLDNDVVKFSLTTRFDAHHGGKYDEHEVVVARIAMPHIHFAKFATKINNLQKEGYKRGILPGYDAENKSFFLNEDEESDDE